MRRVTWKCQWTYNSVDGYDFAEDDALGSSAQLHRSVSVEGAPNEVLRSDSGCSDTSAKDGGARDEDPPSEDFRMAKIVGTDINAPSSTQHTQSYTQADPYRSPHVWTCLLQEPTDIERFPRTCAS